MGSMTKRAKSKLDSAFEKVAQLGVNLTLPSDIVGRLADWSRGKHKEETLVTAIVATDSLFKERPTTLRSLMYRLVGAGVFPSTDDRYYNALGRILTPLREDFVVPFHWIVDNVRDDIKEPCWDTPEDAAEQFVKWYRMNFWSRFNHHVHIIIEKDAMAGVVSPVTREFGVTLSPIRGYASTTYAYEIAQQWAKIDKPIHVYYLGDHDPSGRNLEDNIRERLFEWSKKNFFWTRLGVLPEDVEKFNLLKLKLKKGNSEKKGDPRVPAFLAKYEDWAVEVDALPSTETRRRVREAIISHIPPGGWERCQREEAAQIERLAAHMKAMPAPGMKPHEQN